MRSKLAAFKTITKIDCDTESFGLTRYWSVIDLQTNETLILDNPTVRTAELVFTGNNLDYGDYRLIYEVTVSFNNDADRVKNTVDSFITVIPSGFVMLALPNGITSMTIGTSQVLTLRPGNFSYDLDAILNPVSMSFRFYCRVSINGFVNKNFSTELKQHKTQGLPFTSDDCFSSPGLKFAHLLC
jgi:hypothetical protein